MSNLIKIARSASPDTDVQFRRDAYGTSGVRRFLRDVIALANAAVDGPRYIVTGIDFDKSGRKKVYGVNRDDFSGKPSYQSLVADFIEPPIRIKYQPVTLDGKRVGVYEIGECQDRPYMMRVDQSEMLRRGDAYVRIKNVVVKMGRRQLQDLFESKFRDSVSAERIEIGFPGEIIHKSLRISTTNLANLPSALAGAKLKQLVDIRSKSKNTGSTTVMARLTHARLFGSDSPYKDRSADDLVVEMDQIERKHAEEDNHFLFETNPQTLQIVVLNQGEDTIEDASLSLVMPNHHAFHVARKLPMVMHNGKLGDRGAREIEQYPVVNLKDDAVHVSATLGEMPSHTPVTVFEVPLRICVESSLKGRKLGIRYTLFGKNLRAPAKGTLRLLFE